MCSNPHALRREVQKALAPFWKRSGDHHIQGELYATVSQLRHGDRITLTFANAAAKHGAEALQKMGPILRVAPHHEPLIDRAITEGSWGDDEHVELDAEVHFSGNVMQRYHATRLFTVLLSPAHVGLRELKVHRSFA